MARRKNILLLIPNLDFGGAQRSFSKLSIELAKKHNVFVGVFNTFDGIAYPFGGTLIDLNIPGSASIPGKIANFRQRIKQVKEIKRTHSIDLCISFLEGADYINILSKVNDRTVVSIRGSKTHDGEISGAIGWLRKKVMMPLLYKKADVVVSVSEGIKYEMMHDFGLDARRIVTIYNFYETRKLLAQAAEPLEEKYETIFRHPVIINSGRLHIQKAHSPLLEVFAQTKAKDFAKLVIIGEGGLKDLLLEKAKSLGLRAWWWGQSAEPDENAQVYFIGYQDNPFKFIQKAGLFAFTSSWEGFPNALAEAMICGVPVVTTDCPTGPREILAPGSKPNPNLHVAEQTKFGVLMPLLNQPENFGAIKLWVETIDNVLADKTQGQTYAANAQDRMQDFTPETIFSQWEQIVDQES